MVPWLAGGVVLAGIGIALILPMYTCAWGDLEEIRTSAQGSELICIQSDLGYRPRSWLPTKIAVAVGGAVLAAATVLAARGRAAAASALAPAVA